MNILIEGCDCVGKSTVITELLKLDDFTVEHNAAGKSKLETKQLYEQKTINLQHTNNHIMDRLFLSECVYGQLYRNYYPNYIRQLELKLPNVVLILITADTNVIIDRFDNKNIDIKDIDDIKIKFLEEFNRSNYRYKFVIDSSVLSPKQIANIIYNLIKEIEKND